MCQVAGGGLRSSRETLALGWIDPGALPDTLFPWYRAPIADALGAPATPVRRYEHQGLSSILAGMRIDLKTRARGIRGELRRLGRRKDGQGEEEEA